MDKQATELAKELFTVGAHFGYSRSRRHPTVAKHLFGTKNKVDIINIESTAQMLLTAGEYMKSIGAKAKPVIFVGSKPEAKEATKRAAEGIGAMYVTSRWIGGTLTNFSEIKKRLSRLEEMRAAKISGELEKKYTKKEQLLIAREVAKMEEYFSGLVSLKALPEALIIVDPKKEINAVREAKRLGITIVAIASTDCDTTMIDYPIVANDSSRATIEFIINHLANSYRATTE